jgi:hypothetical protein
MGPRGSNGANGNEMHIIFLHTKVAQVSDVAHGPLVQVSGGCHYYTCTGERVANFCLAFVAFKSEGFFYFFYMPRLLRHGTLVHMVSSEGSVPTSHSGI